MMEACVTLEPRDKRDKKTIGTSVRLPEGLHADVEAYAEGLNRSFNEVLTYLVQKGWELEQAERRGDAEVYTLVSMIKALAARALRLLGRPANNTKGKA